jgi:hypothetical protein
VRVLELDRILDGDDVLRIAAINLVDERRNRCGLSRARRAADEDQSVVQARNLLDLRWQTQLAQPRRHRRECANRRRRSPTLAMQIHTEAAAAL